MIKNADVLLDPMRPGVLEKMGLGPDYLLKEVNPKLVVARVTGWGQSGPYAPAAGHDSNYVSLTGILSLFARNENMPPLPPVNLLGDFAGGGALAAFGVVLALYERTKSGKGQVVDAAMVDGVSHLATFIHRMRYRGSWNDTPGTNVLDTGAPFYETYQCSDGKFISVACIEPHFHALMIKGLGLEDDFPGMQSDRSAWPMQKRVLAGRIAQKPRDHWAKVFSPDGPYRDACVAPVLTIEEAQKHPHNVARNVFTKVGDKGELMPSPAPRLSRTPGHVQQSWKLVRPGDNTRTVLMMYGFSDEEISKLASNEVVSLGRQSKL